MRLGTAAFRAGLTVILAKLIADYLDRDKLSRQTDLDLLCFLHKLGFFHLWSSLVVLAFVLNVVTGEVSWVDRLWSILPPISAWLIALRKLPILPSKPGVRPDYLRDIRHSTLSLVQTDKRNPLLVGLELFGASLADWMRDPADAAGRVVAGLHLDFWETNVLSLCLASLITLWGLRLSYNFYRKGGYARGGEDYRWIRVRSWFGIDSSPNGTPGLCIFGDSVLGRKFGSLVAFPLFNLIFICFFSLWLLVMGIPAPFLRRLLTNPVLLPSDLLLFLLFAALLLLETAADQQQWEFHRRKADRSTERVAGDATYDSSDDETLGFLRCGLFSFSRHPNFFAELSMWWLVYLLSVMDGRPNLSTYNLTIFGALSLTNVFLGSTPMTENLSCEKYGAFYEEYRRRVARIVPWS